MRASQCYVRQRCWYWWLDPAAPARTRCWTPRAAPWRATRGFVSCGGSSRGPPMPAARTTNRSPKPHSPQRDFALQWQAHGLRYGIPADIADDLAAGVVVVANVSRGVIAEAADRFPVRVIEITAPPQHPCRAAGRRAAAKPQPTSRRVLPAPCPLPDGSRGRDGAERRDTARSARHGSSAALNRAASDARQ